MGIGKMLIKQCHDLLTEMKHLLFQSQRLGFLENVAFGHSDVDLFTSIRAALTLWKIVKPCNIIWFLSFFKMNTIC